MPPRLRTRNVSEKRPRVDHRQVEEAQPSLLVYQLLPRAMSSVPKSKTCLRVLLGKAETGPILFLPSLLAAPQEVVLFHPHADKVPVPMKDFILHAERHSYRTEPDMIREAVFFLGEWITAPLMFCLSRKSTLTTSKWRMNAALATTRPASLSCPIWPVTS